MKSIYAPTQAEKTGRALSTLWTGITGGTYIKNSHIKPKSVKRNDDIDVALVNAFDVNNTTRKNVPK